MGLIGLIGGRLRMQNLELRIFEEDCIIWGIGTFQREGNGNGEEEGDRKKIEN
jgi:hypothetical protein